MISSATAKAPEPKEVFDLSFEPSLSSPIASASAVRVVHPKLMRNATGTARTKDHDEAVVRVCKVRFEDSD